MGASWITYAQGNGVEHAVTKFPQSWLVNSRVSIFRGSQMLWVIIRLISVNGVRKVLTCRFEV